jgi:flagellar basal-body rod modification protein FlgD
MSISATSATNAATATAKAYDPAEAGASRLPQQVLGQDDFLRLLVAQLSSQDPLNPISNTDFAAQMAQFSTLQATETMQQTLSAVQSGLALLEAGSLLGRTVNITTTDGQTISGPVSAVQYQGGTPSVVVNGQTYPVTQVSSVAQTQTQTQSN